MGKIGAPVGTGEPGALSVVEWMVGGTVLGEGVGLGQWLGSHRP
jgi:hypothetical protein